MVDVKIGLATESLGQFGEGFNASGSADFSQDKILSEAVGRRRQYFCEPAYWGSLSMVASKSMLLTWLFCVIPKERNFENDIVCKRSYV